MIRTTGVRAKHTETKGRRVGTTSLRTGLETLGVNFDTFKTYSQSTPPCHLSLQRTHAPLPSSEPRTDRLPPRVAPCRRCTPEAEARPNGAQAERSSSPTFLLRGGVIDGSSSGDGDGGGGRSWGIFPGNPWADRAELTPPRALRGAPRQGRRRHLARRRRPHLSLLQGAPGAGVRPPPSARTFP